MKKNASRGVGRPMANINIPNRKFTFADLEEANSHVTPLTLRKFLKRDADRKGKSEIVLVKGETRAPQSKNGLGRKTFVYVRRAKVAKVTAPKAAVKAKAAKSPKASTKSTSYEAKKAALLGDNQTAPVTAPVAPAPVTATAPTPVAAETAAPVAAPETVTA